MNYRVYFAKQSDPEAKSENTRMLEQQRDMVRAREKHWPVGILSMIEKRRHLLDEAMIKQNRLKGGLEYTLKKLGEAK
ncbi:hypothetical protein E8E11_010035 [Didymella keratinophila]|nr:hypothetical protein E8E11_010035 [Didymella keratinophila]